MPYEGVRGSSYMKVWEELEGLHTINNTMLKFLNLAGDDPTAQYNFSVDGEAQGASTTRFKLMEKAQTEGWITPQIDKYLKKDGNGEKWSWLHQEFDTGQVFVQSGKPIITSNWKQIQRFHDIVKLIKDMNVASMRGDGLFTDKPVSADMQNLYKDLTPEQQAEVKGSYDLMSGQDLVFHNNKIVSAMTVKLHKAMKNGDNIILDDYLMSLEKDIAGWMLEYPSGLLKDSMRQNTLELTPTD